MRRLNGMWPLGSYVPLPQKIFVGHWKFVKVTEAAHRSAVGHEVALVVAHCTERRLGKKKYPKSFFNSMEILNGYHLKPACEWLMPLLVKDFGGSGLPLSYRSKWFKVEARSRQEGSRVVDYLVYLPKIPRWMIEFGYESHYHTQQWIPNGDAETEQDHLIKYLDAHFGWDLLGGRFFASRFRDLNIFKKRVLKQIHRKEMKEEMLDSKVGDTSCLLKF